MATVASGPPHRRGWYRPMQARRPDEDHRAATPLELFFDLCFVVAVAQAATGLHHALAEDHPELIVNYVTMFTALWWAWMNFTWFASAFDTDDAPYRIATFVQIAGALIIAAGIPRAFEEDLTLVVTGFVVTRVGLVSMWLRAASGSPEQRTCCLRYAVGLVIVMVGWMSWLDAPDDLRWPIWFVLMTFELAVPAFAERAGATPWHPHHIAERYGLFTIIVLGESILAATVAFQTAFDERNVNGDLLALALSGVLIVCSAWWLYFEHAEGPSSTLRGAFTWGYGHLPLFTSTAAIGAGLAVNVDFVTDHAEITATVARMTLAVPIAAFLVSLWLVAGIRERTRHELALPVGAVAILAAGFTTAGVPIAAGVLVLLVAFQLVVHSPRPTRRSTGSLRRPNEPTSRSS